MYTNNVGFFIEASGLLIDKCDIIKSRRKEGMEGEAVYRVNKWRCGLTSTNARSYQQRAATSTPGSEADKVGRLIGWRAT